MVMKNIEIAASVHSNVSDVWEQIVRALADAAVETEGRAIWLASIGSDKAPAVKDAAMILRLLVTNAADLQTSERNETHC